MSVVYRAHDVRHNRTVAVKLFRPQLAGPLGIDGFLREIMVAAGLQHPHILPVFDSGAVDEGSPAAVPWFVMPFVEGESLRHRLQRSSRLPVDEAVTLAGEVADALAYAHAHGVVHRDIKPENILLTGCLRRDPAPAGGGHAVVADFGVAQAIEHGAATSPACAAPQLTRAGLAVGTPEYMSPEQATGAEAVDARADQYSLRASCTRCSSAHRPSSAPGPRRSSPRA
jgi:serine/threonine-protein kinase